MAQKEYVLLIHPLLSPFLLSLSAFRISFLKFIFQIAEELPPEVLKEYKDIFSFFDRDGGGSIGADEFDQVKTKNINFKRIK